MSSKYRSPPRRTSGHANGCTSAIRISATGRGTVRTTGRHEVRAQLATEVGPQTRVASPRHQGECSARDVRSAQRGRRQPAPGPFVDPVSVAPEGRAAAGRIVLRAGRVADVYDDG